MGGRRRLIVVHRCCRMAYVMFESQVRIAKNIIHGLVLLREAPWSSKAVEEQHGSMAVMHRYHPEMDSDNLSVRSHVHTCRLLVIEPSNALLRHTEAAIARLDKKRPGRVRPISMFVSDAVAAARRHVGPTGLPFEGAQRVVSQAASSFAELPPAAAAHYAGKARLRAVQSQRAIDSERQFLKDQLAMIEGQREKDTDGAGHPASLVCAQIPRARLCPTCGAVECRPGACATVSRIEGKCPSAEPPIIG